MILYRRGMEELDLHGEDRIGAKIKIEAFLSDNFKLQNKEIAIVCGIGNNHINSRIKIIISIKLSIKVLTGIPTLFSSSVYIYTLPLKICPIF